MSDAAPAKVQKTERSDTPHHSRPGAKSKGQSKRPQHNKVGAARRRLDTCPALLLTCVAPRLALRRATKTRTQQRWRAAALTFARRRVRCAHLQRDAARLLTCLGTRSRCSAVTSKGPWRFSVAQKRR